MIKGKASFFRFSAFGSAARRNAFADNWLAFDDPSSGTIVIGPESLMIGIRPNLRSDNMCFQSLRIFPHLNVSKTSPYGLNALRLGREGKKENRVLARGLAPG